MSARIIVIASLLLAVAGCSAIGRLTVKDYTAKSGERVMAGQAEPKDEYNCRKLSQEEQDWGLSGNMDKAAAMERVTSVAVETAPKKGANYAYIIAPSETSILGFNVNAFSDAEVAYYQCANLPPAE
ncbi:MAG: hypothetical protein KY410_08740 [Proteobacteria bacterium]|nr:hypothetical protein [Pseudomonadota bacterium]